MAQAETREQAVTEAGSLFDRKGIAELEREATDSG